MSLVSVIRRWHFREGVSIRQIAKRSGLSRNTVRRYLADRSLEPSYPPRHTPSKLDDYTPTLTSWLHRESKRHRKQRRTVKQLHIDLMRLGFTGSYDRVAAFARQWREKQFGPSSKQAFVPLRFAPGEAFQFDWSEDWVVIGGVRQKLQIAHFKLSHSRAFFLRAYRQQGHELLFDAHFHAFTFFGGVPERGIYDNMKTAVDKVIKGKERIVNRRFQAMVSHYLFEADFCNPAAGWEKGQVEKQVRDARHSIWQQAPRCTSVNDLNAWLEQRCIELCQSMRHPEFGGTIAQAWNIERQSLMAVPSRFDDFVEHSKRVSSTCLINFDRNRYSVPASFANRVVSVHVYATRIVIVAEGQQIAEHTRSFSVQHLNVRGKTIYDWRHYLTVIQRKPGALRNGAPFEDMPERFKALQDILLKRPGGDREMASILSLVLFHDEDLVLQAVELALAIGRPSRQHVLNCLNRLKEPLPPEPVPSSIRLQTEPLANTQHFDRLREGKHVH